MSRYEEMDTLGYMIRYCILGKAYASALMPTPVFFAHSLLPGLVTALERCDESCLDVRICGHSTTGRTTLLLTYKVAMLVTNRSWPCSLAVTLQEAEVQPEPSVRGA